MDTTLKVAKDCLQAYVNKDRAAAERLIADDFHFTSPLDNGLDRATYFQRCWPNSEGMEGFAAIHGCEDGEQAFLIYEAWLKGGKRFRNCEVYTARNGQLTSVEVYFGWNLPHKAPRGSFVEAAGCACYRSDRQCQPFARRRGRPALHEELRTSPRPTTRLGGLLHLRRGN